MIEPPIIKESQEHTLFITGRGSAMDDKWYHIPFIFERVGKNLFRHWTFNNLPVGVKKYIHPLIEIDNEQFNTVVDHCIERMCDYWRDVPGGSFDKLIEEVKKLKKPLQ